MAYALENRCVFSCLLKTPKSLIVRRFFGSAFHSLGAAARKALFPRVLHLVFGTSKRRESEDLRLY